MTWLWWVGGGFAALVALLAYVLAFCPTYLQDRPHPEPPLSTARHRVSDDGQRPGADGQFGTWPTLRPDDKPACPSPPSLGDGHDTTEVRDA